MKVERQHFLKAYQQIAPLAAKRTTLPVLNMARLEASFGVLTLAATDLDCHGVVSCPCDGDLEPICVSAAALLNLAEIASESMTIEPGNKRLRIKSNGSAELAIMSAEEFPPFPSEKVQAQGIPVGDLADCIEAVMWAADEKYQLDRPYAACVMVNCEPKKVLVWAFGGPVFALIQRDIIAVKLEFLLPVKYASAFCKALRCEGAVLKTSESYAIAESPEIKLAVRLMDVGAPGNFMDVANQEAEDVGELEIQPIIDALSNVESVGNAEFLPTVVEFSSPIKIAFSGNDSAYETTLDLGSKKIGKSIRINPRLAKRLLNSIPTPKARLSVAQSAILVKTGEYTAALALIT